jgi:predicted enzyme related to lactoylglutathione lyase
VARLVSITIDCADAKRLAGFRTMALDGYMSDESGVLLKSDDGHGPIVHFQEVAEPKAGKNRLHFNIESSDAKGEIFRLERLGGKVIEEKSENGHEWVVMTDIEGNEFCVSPI